jgi:cytidylate kinase
LLETLNEKGLTVLEDWIATLVFKRHLWPNQYLKSLMKVISTIGRHGRAVILGRGANFILCPECPDVSFRVRIVAPLEMRVQNVARDFNIESEEAKRRVLRTESNRRAFVRKYFHADITDPYNYDLVINIETLSIDAATEAIKGALGR